MLSPPNSPTGLVSRAGSDDGHGPLACASEEGSPHTGKWDDMASSPRLVGPSCMAPQRVSRDLPERVLTTITEARALSTRYLYVLKWDQMQLSPADFNIHMSLCT
ncbi:hypothetical protein PO909_013433 [Leuciscus waleckii]